MPNLLKDRIRVSVEALVVKAKHPSEVNLEYDSLNKMFTWSIDAYRPDAQKVYDAIIDEFYGGDKWRHQWDKV